MKINSIEMYSFKRMNSKMNSASYMSEVPTTEQTTNAANGMNNVSFGGGVQSMAKAGKYVTGAAALALLAVSCQKTPWISVRQEVNVDLSAMNAMYQEMLSLYKAMLDQQKITNDKFDQLNLYMLELLNKYDQEGKSAAEFRAAVLAHFATIEGNQNILIDMLKENGKTEEEIKTLLEPFFNAYNKGDFDAAWKALMDILKSIDGNVSGILQQLKAMEASINAKIEEAKESSIQNKIEIIAAMNDLKAAISKIQPGSSDLSNIEAWLAIINESIKGIDPSGSGAVDYTKLLTDIINAINNLQIKAEVDVEFDTSKLEALINKAIDVLKNLKVNVDVTVDTSKLEDLIKEAIVAINNITIGSVYIDTSVLEGLVKSILDKLGTMDEHQQQNALDLLSAINSGNTAIVNAINNLSKQSKEDLQVVVDAINKNTDVAKGSYEILVWFMNNIDKFDRADDIIDAIKGIALNVDVDLTSIIPYLEQILASSLANGGKIDTTNEYVKKIYDWAVGTLNNQINALLALGNDITDNQKEELEWLEKIFNKIPPEHECDHSTLIEIILRIEDWLKNHEGTDQPGSGDDLFSYNSSIKMDRNDKMNDRANKIRNNMLNSIYRLENSSLYAKLDQDAKKDLLNLKNGLIKENDSKTYRIYEDMLDQDFVKQIKDGKIESMA